MTTLESSHTVIIPDGDPNGQVENVRNTAENMPKTAHLTTVNDPGDRFYQTVWYACGHPMLRGVFHGDHTLSEIAAMPREIMSPFNCRHCQVSMMRAMERRMEKSRGVA